MPRPRSAAPAFIRTHRTTSGRSASIEAMTLAESAAGPGDDGMPDRKAHRPRSQSTAGCRSVLAPCWCGADLVKVPVESANAHESCGRDGCDAPWRLPC